MAEKPFDRMADEIPKASKPTEAAAPQKEEQDVPKLSPQEFRVYNRMAEHMDMFVCLRQQRQAKGRLLTQSY